MGKRNMRHKVLSVRDISPTTYVLRLERNGFEFKPGQCVNLGIPGTGVNREYSTYSGAGSEFLEFLIKEVPGGTVSTKLRAATPGAEVDLHGPYGSFVLDPARIIDSQFVFIASGTGIAPFHSFVTSYPELDCQIIHGIRQVAERCDIEDFDSRRVVTCVSREPLEGKQGRVTDYLKEASLNTESIYYLCGNQAMIYDVYDLLRQGGVSGDKIFTEAFF